MARFGCTKEGVARGNYHMFNPFYTMHRTDKDRRIGTPVTAKLMGDPPVERSALTQQALAKPIVSNITLPALRRIERIS